VTAVAITGRLQWLSVQHFGTNVHADGSVYLYVYALTFECMLQVVQQVYRERHTGLTFTNDNSVVPYAWYDASNDRDIGHSLCISGAITMMMGGRHTIPC
jgi:hypothetical protein